MLVLIQCSILSFNLWVLFLYLQYIFRKIHILNISDLVQSSTFDKNIGECVVGSFVFSTYGFGCRSIVFSTYGFGCRSIVFSTYGFGCRSIVFSTYGFRCRSIVFTSLKSGIIQTSVFIKILDFSMKSFKKQHTFQNIHISWLGPLVFLFPHTFK